MALIDKFGHERICSDESEKREIYAVEESNIRRRHENPSPAALANRKYQATKKEREVLHARIS